MKRKEPTVRERIIALESAVAKLDRISEDSNGVFCFKKLEAMELRDFIKPLFEAHQPG